MKKLFYIAICFFIIGCKKENKIEKGKIEIVTNIYYNASNSLDDYDQFHISTINFHKNNIIEFVRNIYDSEIIDSVIVIKDTMYYPLHLVDNNEINQIDFSNINFTNSVFNKKTGTIWVKDSIIDYNNRKDLSDTIIFDKPYKRFAISNEKALSIFWIQKTDSILPYSFNKIVDRNYNGQLNRIDSYGKEKDVFTTLLLIYDKNIDKAVEAKLTTF